MSTEAIEALREKWDREMIDAAAKSSHAAAMHSMNAYAREASRCETLRKCIADLSTLSGSGRQAQEKDKR
jgi:hypothetical protein